MPESLLPHPFFFFCSLALVERAHLRNTFPYAFTPVNTNISNVMPLFKTIFPFFLIMFPNLHLSFTPIFFLPRQDNFWITMLFLDVSVHIFSSLRTHAFFFVKHNPYLYHIPYSLFYMPNYRYIPFYFSIYGSFQFPFLFHHFFRHATFHHYFS